MACDWCGYTGSGWDAAHVAHRIDPADCGCTDCILGFSKPAGQASDYELDLMSRSIVDNATGEVPSWNPEATRPIALHVDVDTREAHEKIAASVKRIDELDPR